MQEPGAGAMMMVMRRFHCLYARSKTGRDKIPMEQLKREKYTDYSYGLLVPHVIGMSFIIPPV